MKTELRFESFIKWQHRSCTQRSLDVHPRQGFPALKLVRYAEKQTFNIKPISWKIRS